MAEADRERWDRRYRDSAQPQREPPAWLVQNAALLPDRGGALDVAAGAGRSACWLAARGLSTLAVDISPEGLRLARECASAEGLTLETRVLDLEHEPLPAGPFDVIVCFDYLQRELFAELSARLAPGGLLVCEIKTRENLQRNPHPSARFLLERGELPRLCAGLEIVACEEGWRGDIASARVVGRRHG